MRTLAIIQARMSSQRLPGKMLKPLGGKPVLQHVLERVAMASVDEVVLATSEDEQDDALAELADNLDIPTVRGPVLNDVFCRFLLVLERYPCNAFVRVTGDCCLIEPALINACIAEMETGRWDYVSATEGDGYCDGLDVEVMRTQTFQTIDTAYLTDREREHVTERIRNWRGVYCAKVLDRHDLAQYRKLFHLSLDTPDDYERLQQFFEWCNLNGVEPSGINAIRWLECQ